MGINAFPLDRKICTFDCLYCQYGFEEPVGERSTLASDLFPPASVILDHLEKTLKNYKDRIDYITFSGNGEPTLHPEFHELVEGVVDIRDRFYPEARIALLSNGTTIVDREIRDTLRFVDDPIIKLDAGEEILWKKINRPGGGISFGDVIEALETVDHIIIQSIFFEGDNGQIKGNVSKENLDKWFRHIKRINPRYVQIYTLDRKTAVRGLRCVGTGILEEIRNDLMKAGIKGRVY
jgi:wyosine [tRNA(Phe)-imidazoG37] synthetase (radical SAM superfamily)